ncbi:unnamed protein product [Hyaloperonospora brassicae]|uniref:L-seryl-tRNA(Sec) kinase n=1 Tax=Hyaloperonospora brassicae TaxID=162125 RepID=A0AAV0UBK2_HYABA|nr:unnamed protein product [Hyaloperonospora brassicae]
MCGSSSNAVLVLVCGLPAAGKTTLVKQLVATRTTWPSLIYERMSFDDLYEHQVSEIGISSQPSEFDAGAWKTSQQEMVRRASERLQEHASTKTDESKRRLVLLVDDNFPYRSQRKRYFHLATDLNCGFGVLYMNVAVATCRERNANRGKDRNAGTRIADEVFERMVTRFEAPNGRQNAWEVITSEVKETGDGYDVDDVMNALIQRANLELHRRRLLQVRVQEDATQQHCDRLSTQQNVLHLVDLRLRQWISAQLQDGTTLPPGTSKSQFASQLNRRRKDYLAIVKHSYDNDSDRRQEESVETVLASLLHRFQHQE